MSINEIREGHNRIMEIVNEFMSARPRVLEEAEAEAKQRILEELRSTREDINTEYVVEGATVRCTQMVEKAPSRPGPWRLLPIMQRLDIETRMRRKRVIGIVNPDRRFGALERSGIDESINMNGPKLLTHMDIEFKPLFGSDPVEETPPTLSNTNNNRIKNLLGTNKVNPNFPATIGGCGGCQFAGDCKPDIDQLMWQDCDGNGVDVTGAHTILQNTAYMFCHYGQGILYIDDSGQQLSAMSDGFEPYEEIFIGTAMGGNPRTRNIGDITHIVLHHSVTPNDEHRDISNLEEGWRNLGWSLGGYHEIILRNGTVQIAYDPEVETNGAHEHNGYTYHICLVGTGPWNRDSNARLMDGAPFTEQQEIAYKARLQANIERLPNFTTVTGHGDLRPVSSVFGGTLCPGLPEEYVKSGNISALPSQISD